jgi:hypothetical protein
MSRDEQKKWRRNENSSPLFQNGLPLLERKCFPEGVHKKRATAVHEGLVRQNPTRRSKRVFSAADPNKAAAAARARDIYLHLVSHGWDPTLGKYKPKRSEHQATPEKQSPCTVGTFLEEVLRSASNRRTVEGYATAFRTIVSDSFGLSVDKKKYDYYYGGRIEWLNRVHSIALDQITPARIQEWKQSFLAKAGSDPLTLRKARISVNSLMRRARP